MTSMRNGEEKPLKENRTPRLSARQVKKLSLLLAAVAAFIAAAAVWGPEMLAAYRDKAILNQIRTQETEKGTAGYRYSLSGNEKVYILAKCLDSRSLPESEQNAMARTASDDQPVEGNYAFVANKREAAGQEGASEASGIELCNKGLEELKELGILPGEVQSLQEGSSEAVLYSAIDVSEPRNSVLVWKASPDMEAQPGDREARLLEIYVDADTGKVYEFYARTGIASWEEIDAEGIAETWAEYMGLEEPRAYENANPLSEDTPYFQKYCFAGMEGDDTVVTIGFYEGINEMYLKISR